MGLAITIGSFVTFVANRGKKMKAGHGFNIPAPLLFPHSL